MQGRHFLHIPGPSPIPDRILRAIAMPIIDHRSAEFGALGKEVLEGSKAVFKTSQPVVIYPSSGTGAWEAAITNTLSPGDTVLMAETGHFATLWKQIATRFGITVEFIPGDWRHGADPVAIEARLAEDKAHAIKAVMVVHNETSTGATSRVAEIRKAIDAAGHPALFMVDTISSLASVDYRHDEWQVDVTVSGSQKGLMLPPGLSFNAISEKALAASKTNKLPRSYWDWQEMVKINASGFFPYTPATNLLYGLKEALAMLQEEGLDNVFTRHQRLAAACRAAVKAWGLEVLCQNPDEYSPVLTAVLMPPSHDADRFRKIALEKYNISLGSGLGKVAGKVFRIGHLGECNELSLLGALSGVELGLSAAGVPHRSGGVAAAMASFEGQDKANETAVAAVA
ncbi:pyridoxal-phosphate-dependent aminotransferase family protein [Bosea robiniae]|jgi:alanine-glyoxylate transaminase/serine-glyoxylate transaminase/serine-pyruvate transaminase|uniref:Alanine-glyoxylate transaminase / serine-glyoxylate transaminase / serine-pyruvate transaminase n=1 Tax=Bosea robiniae TaxID=1036780 RepID=A0ABY0P4F2_9HYPH|nr:aminotransferase class V-fold PLP-dependent enzyme [Bosea robiniae]SDH25561.1 alanine-glyoxylate transaminase / serine-glyoxylate transaminase / serine-pyruvate transaminase [Bosea robiniae]